MLRPLDLNIVDGDVVEVAPQYDHAEITANNAVQVVFELITTMVKNGKPSPMFKKTES